MLSIFLATMMTIIPVETIAPILSDHAQPKYSYNEQSLAYLAPDRTGTYNLYVDGKRLTSERRAITNFFWEPDDQHLLYLYDEKGDENYHLYRVDLEGVSEDLTPFPDVHVEFVDVDSSHPQEALIRMNLRDSRYLDSYQINLETKELSPIFPQVNHRESVIAGEDLQPQVCLNFKPNGQKFLEVYENGAWRPIWTLDPDDWSSMIVGLSPDNQRVMVLSSTGVPTRSLFSIDLQTGSSELLFSHPQLDCLRVYFNPENGKLQAAYVRDSLREWYFFDDEFQEEIESAEKQLGKGEITLLSRLSEDQTWFLAHRQDDSPTAYYLLDRDTKQLKLVLQEAPHLLQYTFGKMEPLHFQASDGQTIQGYFLRPPHGEPPYPTIVEVHGGPHLRHNWGFIPESQYWASQGYATLFINYRGSFGFGKQFAMADSGEWGRQVFQDIIDGKHWAEKKGLVDPNRTFIKGESYGGYLALLGVSLTPEEFVGGIADFPIVEPSSWMPEGYVSWGFTYEKLFREAAIGAISPLSYAHQVQAPLMMLHSENDLRVRLDQSQKMAEALKYYQIPFTYHVLPGDGHGYLDPQNRLFYFKEVEAFLSAELETD
ncbi:MAG: S9 family peptidase [Verrucomicrobia bacterium]|nr:S9 family peptidase [Verrucomicrobiota bacterium]